MSSIEPPVDHFSSSDWMLLSEFLCPNYSSMTELKLVKDSSTEEPEESFDTLNSCNDAIYNDLSGFENNDAFQNSIPEDLNVKCLWSVDYPTLSGMNPTSDVVSKFKLTWDVVSSASMLSKVENYESVIKKPSISTTDAGVQTTSIAIHFIPEACFSLPIPWGLDKDQPSPLTIHSNTTDFMPDKNSKKRKLEDSTWPPKKKPALEDQDPFKLNDLFGFLKSPILNNVDSDCISNNEDSMVVSPTTCLYEGVTDIKHCDSSSRCVSTNTLHVPMRHSPKQKSRQKVWRKAAKQYLTEEDRVSKRRPLQGSQEKRTQRMVDNILAYYCR